jgi:hypothetical protein
MPLDQEKTTSAMFVDEMFFPFLLRVARPMQDMNHPSSWSDNIYISRTSAVSSAGKREYVQRRGAKKKKKNPTATHEMGVSTDHDFLVSISLFRFPCFYRFGDANPVPHLIRGCSRASMLHRKS